jgi:lipid II:glycine glycyltransferase (peptidoglycan interpeptide bridge formation enzyme)
VESGKYQEFIESIMNDAQKERCIHVLLSPKLTLSTSELLHFPLPHFRTSRRHVHPEASLLIDLTQSEEDILKQMHQKGRYNINLARKHGVEIVQGTVHDIDEFYRLLTRTGSRDHFIILQKSQYKRFFESLDGSQLLLAKHEGKVISGVLNAVWNGTMLYYYGASSYNDRHLMAPYLLQWEAMRRAKARGCHTYDLLGIMPPDAPENDPWKGITDFKRKFGGTLVTYPREQVCVLRPVLKKLLELKRKIGMRGRLPGSAP